MIRIMFRLQLLFSAFKLIIWSFSSGVLRSSNLFRLTKQGATWITALIVLQALNTRCCYCIWTVCWTMTRLSIEECLALPTLSSLPCQSSLYFPFCLAARGRGCNDWLWVMVGHLICIWLARTDHLSERLSAGGLEGQHHWGFIIHLLPPEN